MKSKYHSQWTAQFYAAAELTRRGYLVSFTLGNAPSTDLHVTSPEKRSFRVECKGMRSHSFWIFHCDKPDDNLFFIFVYIPPEPHLPRYFLVQSYDAQTIAKNYSRTHPNQKSGYPGGNWTDIANDKNENNWNILPK